MNGLVYNVPVNEKCQICGAQMKAIYYYIKGLVPFIHCEQHGMTRLLTRDEHKRFMAESRK